MTKRAKTRLILLTAAISLFVLVAVIARATQQSSRDKTAARLKISGLEALDRGDYEAALDDLSFTLIRYPDDIEALIGFGDARSRVPDEGGRHLARALSTYNIAVDIARSNGIPRETLISALEGRARLERILGQLARLELTSMELVDLDPQNKLGIESMLAVSFSLGRILPGDANLLIRGEASNEQWVQRLRDAESASALRWVIELAVADELSLDLILAIASILSSQDAMAIQQMQWGEVRENPIDLLDRWAVENPQVREAASVVAAREALIQGRPDESRQRLEQIDLSMSKDPAVILLAISIFEALRTSADRDTANQLLAQLREMKGLDTETQMMLATRYWAFSRTEECLGILESGDLLQSADAKVKVDAILLWMLATPDERTERIESLRKIAEDPASDLLVRNRSAVVVEVADRLGEGGLTAIEFEQQITSLGQWIGDPLLLCVLGDLARADGLWPTALRCYEAARDSFVGPQTPITLRLVAAFSANGDRIGAFEEARMHAGRVNSIQSALVLLRAWIAIEETGRSASDVVPQFSPAGDALDFLESIEGEFERMAMTSERLLPLRFRAMLLRGEREKVESDMEQALGGALSETTLVTLLNIAKLNQLELSSDRIDSLLESKLGPDLDRSLVDYRSSRLASEQGLESAVRFLELYLESDVAAFAIKRRNLFRYLSNEASDTDRAEALDALLQTELDRFEIQETINAAIAQGDIEGSGKIFSYLIDRFGDASPEVASADGRLTLAFDSANEASILQAISRIDRLVAAGVADASLELVLARLWMTDPVRNPSAAIETLLRSAEGRNGEISNLLLLVQLLQEVGRPAEAESTIQRLQQLEDSLTPPQRAFLVKLLGIQGDVEAMRRSACSLAAESGRVEDVIGCIGLCLEMGDTATADQLLDELAARPTRALVVDQALAARFVRNGEVANATEVLRNSEAFGSEADRQTAIATIEMSNGDWAMAMQSLNDLGAELSNSGEAQLLLAICHLRGPERNVPAARDALEGVLALEAGQAGFLRRAASIVIEDADLRSDSEKYIAALREVEREQAEMLQITVDLENTGKSLSSVLPLVSRAEAVRDSLVRVKVAWELYLGALTRGFILARSEGDLPEAQRFAELVDDVATEYRRRFPGDYGVISRAGRIKLLIGDPESAALIARAALEEIRGEVKLVDNLLAAESQYRLENYPMTRKLLEPFAETITRSPGSWPRCWEMLYRSRLYTGDADAALAAYLSWFSSQALEVEWLFWFDAINLASPETAVAAVELVPGVEEIPALQSLGVNALSRVVSRTGDRTVLAELRRRLEDLGSSSSDPVMQIRVGAARVEAAASIDVHRGREEAAEWVDSLPTQILSSISNLSRLSAEERAEVDPFVFAVIITLNNTLARSGEDVEKWQDDSEEGGRIKAFLRRADEVLEDISTQNAEILDSRAIFYLAVGDASTALALSAAAAEMAPGIPGILLTHAKALLASGQRQDAIAVGERARGLHQLSETRAADLQRRIDEFLDDAAVNQGAVETGMDWDPSTVRTSWQWAGISGATL